MSRIENDAISQTAINREEKVKSSGKERWIVYLFALVVLILDYLSKEIVRSNLPLYTYWAPFPAVEQFFRITHTSNTGVAFGMFQNGNFLFAIFASVVSIGIVIFNQKLDSGNVLLRVALGLQLGGALGNLLDRLTHGAVTDFLDFGPWPVFNVADTAVVAGVILMGYVLLMEERDARRSSTETENSLETGEPAESDLDS